MRNLPNVNAVSDDKTNETNRIDLKSWQKKANSEDLHALYTGEVDNQTHYKFHDLFFNLHYSEFSARFFRREILNNVRELVAGTVTVEEIRAKAVEEDSVEQQAKANVMAMIAEMKEAAAKKENRIDLNP